MEAASSENGRSEREYKEVVPANLPRASLANLFHFRLPFQLYEPARNM